MKKYIKSLLKILLIFFLISLSALLWIYYFENDTYNIIFNRNLKSSEEQLRNYDDLVVESEDEDIMPPSSPNSLKFKSTQITPALECKFDQTKNIIYCSTFQMAWNCLGNDIIKETIEISNPPDYINFINAHIKEKPNVSKDSYIAMAGYVKDDIIKKIDEKLLQFKDSLKNLNLSFDKCEPNDIISFSYLFKNLTFETKFEKIVIRNFNNKSDVKGFGINYFAPEISNNLKKQFMLLYCQSPYNSLPEGFILKLITNSDSDELIISTLKSEDNLLNTFRKIDDIINRKYDKYLSRKDSNIFPENYDTFWEHGSVLSIPKINFNILHSYTEFTNKKILNKKFTNHKIVDSLQYIYFDLSEKGAKLKSYSAFMTCSGIPKKYIVNGPFIIYLKNKTSTYPYFMAYICNDEILVK